MLEKKISGASSSVLANIKPPALKEEGKITSP